MVEGEAGMELEGLKRREGKGGARKRRREKGCVVEAVRTNLLGGAARRSASTGEPSGPSNRLRPGQRSSTLYVGRLAGGDKGGVMRGGGAPRRQGRAGGGGSAR